MRKLCGILLSVSIICGMVFHGVHKEYPPIVQAESKPINIIQYANTPLVYHHQVAFTSRDVECLARNIYYEAGVEKDLGKYAVAHITLNRQKTGYWGKSICNVVYSPSQFSWTLNKKLERPDAQVYHRCKEIALDSLRGRRVRGLEHALFYYADYIQRPYWAKNQKLAQKVGTHLFFNSARNFDVKI